MSEAANQLILCAWSAWQKYFQQTGSNVISLH